MMFRKTPEQLNPQPARRQVSLLQIDGIGSFLLIAKPQITVDAFRDGMRASQIDVGLVQALRMPRLEISRDDESYFLSSSEAIEVNGRKSQSHLLHDGDRIKATGRCQLSFMQPNSASSTALLKLTSGRLKRPDISTVILMDRTLIISGKVSSHICIPEMTRTIVLMRKEDEHGELNLSAKIISEHGDIEQMTESSRVTRLVDHVTIPDQKRVQLDELWLTHFQGVGAE